MRDHCFNAVFHLRLIEMAMDKLESCCLKRMSDSSKSYKTTEDNHEPKHRYAKTENFLKSDPKCKSSFELELRQIKKS